VRATPRGEPTQVVDLAPASAAAAKTVPAPKANATKTEASVASTRIAAPPPPPRTAETGVSTASSGMSRRTWSYVAGGAGLALLAGGSLFGIQARSALDKEKTAAKAGDLSAYQSQKSKVKSASNVADALFLTGAAGVGVGTWLFFTSAPAALALDVVPLPGGAVAAISGGF
jgi:hypothetical protein